jgi:hypothetical protein
MLESMSSLKPGWYIVLLPGDSLSMELSALQNHLFRSAGIVQARLLPPCAPLFALNNNDFPFKKPPSVGLGRKIASALRGITGSELLYAPAQLMEGCRLSLPLEKNGEPLIPDPAWLAAPGLSEPPVPESPAAILLAPFIRLEIFGETADTALALCRELIGEKRKTGRMRPSLLRIDKLGDDESEWELFPV